MTDDDTNQAECWQYPFFLIGLGSYAASYKCLLKGQTNQVYKEGRYFRILFESIPMGMITIFAQLNFNN